MRVSTVAHKMIPNRRLTRSKTPGGLPQDVLYLDTPQEQRNQMIQDAMNKPMTENKSSVKQGNTTPSNYMQPAALNDNANDTNVKLEKEDWNSTLAESKKSISNLLQQMQQQPLSETKQNSSAPRLYHLNREQSIQKAWGDVKCNKDTVGLSVNFTNKYHLRDGMTPMSLTLSCMKLNDRSKNGDSAQHAWVMDAADYYNLNDMVQFAPRELEHGMDYAAPDMSQQPKKSSGSSWNDLRKWAFGY